MCKNATLVVRYILYSYQLEFRFFKAAVSLFSDFRESASLAADKIFKSKEDE